MCVKIERRGRKITASYYGSDGLVVAQGNAICNHSDKFDFAYGAGLATKRALTAVQEIKTNQAKKKKCKGK